MAFAGGGLNRPSSRDSAPGPRFFFFAVLSIVLMYFDQRDGWSERIRYVLTVVAYPIQVVIGSPGMLWSATSDLFETRASLRAENAALIKRDRALALTALRYEALEQENARLRNIHGALPPLVRRSQLAEVVNADLGRLRQRLVIDKGDRNGLYRSQAVVDATGLMGQLVRVGPLSAEVMLITDPGHAVPVEIVRNGLRTIAVGTGEATELDLPYVPVTADVKVGDVLVTSGMGGVFPAGVPVGVITESRRDPDEILARVRAQPRAEMDRSHHVLALWFDPGHPAAPVDPKLVESLPPATVGQPVTTPPKPPSEPPPEVEPKSGEKP
ncbi:MAG: rod shape-determining protein MreC [Steroidobacteraceae bacterium]